MLSPRSWISETPNLDIQASHCHERSRKRQIFRLLSWHWLVWVCSCLFSPHTKNIVYVHVYTSKALKYLTHRSFKNFRRWSNTEGQSKVVVPIKRSIKSVDIGLFVKWNLLRARICAQAAKYCGTIQCSLKIFTLLEVELKVLCFCMLVDFLGVHENSNFANFIFLHSNQTTVTIGPPVFY